MYKTFDKFYTDVLNVVKGGESVHGKRCFEDLSGTLTMANKGDLGEIYRGIIDRISSGFDLEEVRFEVRMLANAIGIKFKINNERSSFR